MGERGEAMSLELRGDEGEEGRGGSRVGIWAHFPCQRDFAEVVTPVRPTSHNLSPSYPLVPSPPLSSPLSHSLPQTRPNRRPLLLAAVTAVAAATAAVGSQQSGQGVIDVGVAFLDEHKAAACWRGRHAW